MTECGESNKRKKEEKKGKSRKEITEMLSKRSQIVERRMGKRVDCDRAFCGLWGPSKTSGQTSLRVGDADC